LPQKQRHLLLACSKRAILMTIIHIGLLLLTGILLGYLFKSMIAKAKQQSGLPLPSTEQPSSKSTTRLYNLAQRLMGFLEQAAHPKDLLENTIFQQGVQMLSSGAYSDEQLIEYYAGHNVPIGCMALEALSKRTLSESTIEQIISHIGSRYGWTLFFCFSIAGHRRQQAGRRSCIAQSTGMVEGRSTDPADT
jgi:hypothetical protein